jgi:hypothetical protein
MVVVAAVVSSKLLEIARKIHAHVIIVLPSTTKKHVNMHYSLFIFRRKALCLLFFLTTEQLSPFTWLDFVQTHTSTMSRRGNAAICKACIMVSATILPFATTQPPQAVHVAATAPPPGCCLWSAIGIRHLHIMMHQWITNISQSISLCQQDRQLLTNV